MRKTILSVLLFLSVLCCPMLRTARADSPMPIPNLIEIQIPDLPKGCTVDILADDLRLAFNDKNTDMLNEYNIDVQTSSLYSYYENGWLAAGVRDETASYQLYKTDAYDCLRIIFAEKTPDDFKVIICTKDNEITVSRPIENISSYYVYHVKQNTLQYADTSYYSIWLYIIEILLFMILPALAFTLVIELSAAKLFKLRLKPIALTNLISNPLLNTALMLLSPVYLYFRAMPYWVVVLTLEFAVCAAEFFIYRAVYKTEASKKRLLLFTIAANAASCILYVAFQRYILTHFIDFCMSILS